MSFRKKLSSGEFVILAEMNTPKGVNISELVTNARRIKGRIDAVVIPDMDNGVMRMSALGGGAVLNQNGIETLIHIYGRDRNRMALQADLLAAHVLGMQNLVVVHSEPINAGDHVDAKPVDDLEEQGILRAITSLRGGKDAAGFDLNGTPDFFPGCTLGPFGNEEELQERLELARRKVEAGARFVVTQPVFEIDHFASFLEKVKPLGIPVIPTVFLLKTVGIARYMATYEPGVYIPEDLIKRMRKSRDREMEGIIIAGETVKALKEIAQGVQIVTLGWEHRLPDILDHAGL